MENKLSRQRSGTIRQAIDPHPEAQVTNQRCFEDVTSWLINPSFCLFPGRRLLHIALWPRQHQHLDCNQCHQIHQGMPPKQRLDPEFKWENMKKASYERLCRPHIPVVVIWQKVCFSVLMKPYYQRQPWKHWSPAIPFPFCQHVIKLIWGDIFYFRV